MKQSRDLTVGTPWKQLLIFAIPILIGYVFQLMYSLVDTKVVGLILGEEALAAVGSVSTIYGLFSTFLNGLTQGFALLIAIYFGAKQFDKLKKAFAADIMLSVVIASVMIALFRGALTPILHLLSVPEAQMGMAKTYIVILIWGMFATIFYNMFAHALRAIGDSVTPLIFLVIASALNVVLDFMFVGGLSMGVGGAALATVVAQIVSVLLCLLRVKRKITLLHIERAHFTLEKDMVMDMLKNGFSMALMGSIVALGSVCLQSAINKLGPDIIVAQVASRKVFEILMLPTIVLAGSMATFTGQNFGAKRMDRVKEGFKSAMMIGIVSAVIVWLIGTFGSRMLIRFVASTDNAVIIMWGSRYLRFMVCLLFACTCVCMIRNMLQGMQNRIIPIVSSMIELAGKVVFAFLFVPIMGYWGVILAEPITWVVMLIPLAVRLRKNLKNL